MGKKQVKKGQFGISTEDVVNLRRDIRTAAEQHGIEMVVAELNAECLDSACAALTIDMTRADFGSVRNTIKGLAGPKVKVNKYADKLGPKAARS